MQIIKKHFLKFLPVMIVFLLLCSPLVALAAPLVACNGAEDCNFAKFMETLFNVLRFIIILGVAVIAIVLSWAGFLLLTAGGDSGKITRARKMLWDSIVGFLLAICAYLIVKLLFSTLGVESDFIRFIN